MLAEKHKTSINFLRLPIFSGAKRNDIPDPYEFHYIEKGNKIDVKIRNGNLSPFHRKLFLIIEKLYIHKNPDFEKESVSTSFKEIITEFNSKANLHSKIIDALEDLQNVTIKTVISYRTADGNTEMEEGKIFSPFQGVQWVTTKKYTERNKENLRRYTSKIIIKLQDFHIENLKNKYYRLINYDLVRRLSLKTLRVYDYLNLNAYYLENGRYKQKKRLKVKYPHLIQYLLLKEHTKPSYIEAQLKDKFEELIEKGVLLSYKFDHTYQPTIIDLNLAPSINLWVKKKEVAQEELDNLQQYTVLEKDLHDFGLSNKQIEKLTEKYSEEYLQDKVEQVEYLLQNIPHRINGTASYIYNAIVDNWTDQDYEAHKEGKKQRELNVLSRQREKKLEDLKGQYDKFVAEEVEKRRKILTDDEKGQIEQEVQTRLDNDPICQQRKEAQEFYREIFTMNIIKDLYIDAPSFQEWKEKNSL